jgi:excisionase family DNA binding protein
MSTDDTYPKVLTPEEVAEILQLPVKAITQGVLRHRLPWIKFGRKLRMLSTELEGHLDSLSRYSANK